MRLLTPPALALSMAGLLAGCASTGINSDDPHAPMHEGREPAQMPGTASSSEMDAAPGKSETVRGDGKPDWAAVYETPPGTRYREQQLIYVDRHSLREHKLDKLTYFTATTREVRPAFSGAPIQERAAPGAAGAHPVEDAFNGFTRVWFVIQVKFQQNIAIHPK